MRKTVTRYCIPIFMSACFCFCNNPEKIKEHIEANRKLSAKKKAELSDLNYRINRNSLQVGTSNYDSTIGKDLNMVSAGIQGSIDSLQAQTDSLEQTLPR